MSGPRPKVHDDHGTPHRYKLEKKLKSGPCAVCLAARDARIAARQEKVPSFVLVKGVWRAS